MDRRKIKKLFAEWHEKDCGTNHKMDFSVYQHKATEFIKWLIKEEHIKEIGEVYNPVTGNSYKVSQKTSKAYKRIKKNIKKLRRDL